jgi:hypothetical protein
MQHGSLKVPRNMDVGWERASSFDGTQYVPESYETVIDRKVASLKALLFTHNVISTRNIKANCKERSPS